MSLWTNNTSINFPNIGISLNNVPRGITVFGFNIAFYGVVIAIGMILGIEIARWQAKRSGQNPDLYSDFALIAIPLSVMGARLYSVAFEWDSYKDNLLSIFNLRNGGLAIYGGVIVAIVTCFVYCLVRKMNFGLMADTGILGMIIGQACGRWGNFFNRECFGKFTNSLFAMQIDVTDPSLSSNFKPLVRSDASLASLYEGKPAALANIMEIRNNLVTVGEKQYIQVQPTFLYESVWNICLLIILIIYSPKKKFNGEIILWYLFGYGLGRLWIEGLRTDQLFLWNSPFAVSQLLSGVLVICSAIAIAVLRLYVKYHPGCALCVNHNCEKMVAVAANVASTASEGAASQTEEDEEAVEGEKAEAVNEGEASKAGESEKAEVVSEGEASKAGEGEKVEAVNEGEASKAGESEQAEAVSEGKASKAGESEHAEVVSEGEALQTGEKSPKQNN